MEKLFWTLFGVGELGLLWLVVRLVNSGVELAALWVAAGARGTVALATALLIVSW